MTALTQIMRLVERNAVFFTCETLFSASPGQTAGTPDLEAVQNLGLRMFLIGVMFPKTEDIFYIDIKRLTKIVGQIACTV